MDVLFLSPSYPPEMPRFVRGLAAAGARVWGVGDSDEGQVPGVTEYLRLPSMGDEDAVLDRTVDWLGDRRPDRIEGLWEPVTLLAARIRERLGIPGMSVDTVRGFRDKIRMKQRVASAGVPVPPAVEAHDAQDVRAFARSQGFPLILKPVDGAGSADTFRVDDEEELQAVLSKLGALAAVDVEAFVTGPEHTYDTLCIDGTPVFESVSQYLPNTLVARQEAWISPIILCLRDLDALPGPAMGRQALTALGMGTGLTHLEWFHTPTGPVFGEVACRPPGANMVDLMNYAHDIDLYRAWADAVVHGTVSVDVQRPDHAAIVFKRAHGSGHIRRIEGLDAFVACHGPHVARIDLLPIGAPRRDWRQTFLSDGNLVVRHPDRDACQAMAEEAAAAIHLYAE